MSVLPEPRWVGPAEAWALAQRGRDPVFLDTRNPYHRARSGWQIPGSLRIWRGELEERIDEVPRNRPVVIYCACHYEHSSTRAALILEEYGFAELYILVGGIKTWEEAGLALEPKSPESESVKHLAVGPFG